MFTRVGVALAYLAILIFFAIRAKNRTRTVEDYYVGGRNVPTLLVVLSFYATFVSTNSFVGHSAKSYVYGVSWLLVGAILVALTLAAWFVVAPRFRERAGALGSVVPSDLFRLEFGSRAAGAVAGGIILFDSIFFLAAILLGAGEAMGSLLGLPFGAAVIIVFSIQLVYTAVGGYLADIWSDSLQALILVAGVILLPLALVAAAGGWGATWSVLVTMDAERMAAGERFSLIRITTAAPLVMIVGVGLSGGLKLVADPRQLSRFYGLKDTRAAKRGVWLIAGLVALTYICLLPIGLLARAYGVPDDVAMRTDAIVPWLLGEAQIVGPVIGTVILTALLAAAMSTIDSVLLVAAGALQRDILPLAGKGTPGRGVNAARRGVLVCAALALGLATLARAFPGADIGIVELTVFAGALYAGAFLPGLIGILYWKRASATGAIAGMITGVASTALWRFGVLAAAPGLEAVSEVFVGVTLGTIAFVIGSLYKPRQM